jgi:hypothetical protein
MNKFLASALLGLFLCGCVPANEPAKPAPVAVQKAEKPKTAVLVNGLGVYGQTGMMRFIKAELEKRGWKVTVISHVAAKNLTVMPRVLIGHSMGANAALKRSRIFIKNHPDLIVSIDAGRAPLWHVAPESNARVVDISCGLHPIGGQSIQGADIKHSICGTLHSFMPHDQRVIDIIIKEVEALK